MEKEIWGILVEVTNRGCSSVIVSNGGPIWTNIREKGRFFLKIICLLQLISRGLETIGPFTIFQFLLMSCFFILYITCFSFILLSLNVNIIIMYIRHSNVFTKRRVHAFRTSDAMKQHLFGRKQCILLALKMIKTFIIFP